MHTSGPPPSVLASSVQRSGLHRRLILAAWQGVGLESTAKNNEIYPVDLVRLSTKRTKNISFGRRLLEKASWRLLRGQAASVAVFAKQRQKPVKHFNETGVKVKQKPVNIEKGYCQEGPTEHDTHAKNGLYIPFRRHVRTQHRNMALVA